jgi:hypothetical protein
MRLISLILGFGCLCVTACAPATMNAVPASIVLPTGETCAWAGEGATLAFEGKRLNYSCGSPELGLIGEVQLSADTVTVEKVNLQGNTNGFEIASSEIVTGRITRVTLASGEACAFAGTGATLASAGKRVNYTCSEDTVLLGDFSYEAGFVSVEQGKVSQEAEGFSVTPSGTVSIQTLVLETIE